MLRPPRGKKRFTGSGIEAAGNTNLSNVSAEADGRAMRRRYAFYAAACLAVLALIIGLSVGGGDKGKSSTTSEQKSDVNTPAVKMENFELVAHAYVSSIEAQVNTYKHKKSGMQILTVTPKDITQDATFGLNFRTIPQNNHGTAYVVEHAILSGSEKYPVRDPFNQLQRGSLQTYMDTWTSKDRTAFVMASRNKVDYRNNIKVLLDAVFHPLMVNEDHKWVFRQEGWRLEVVGENKDLVINGCVT